MRFRSMRLSSHSPGPTPGDLDVLRLTPEVGGVWVGPGLGDGAHALLQAFLVDGLPSDPVERHGSVAK